MNLEVGGIYYIEEAGDYLVFSVDSLIPDSIGGCTVMITGIKSNVKGKVGRAEFPVQLSSYEVAQVAPYSDLIGALL